MEYRIYSNVDSYQIITEQTHGYSSLLAMLRSLNSEISEEISQQVSAIALYLASAEDLATTVCFLDFYDIKDFPSCIAYPVVDFLD